MVLSTSELQPTFSTSGIQIPTTRTLNAQVPFIPTVNTPLESTHSTQYQLFPATVTSSGASRLLLAVPATATPLDASGHACYLQTLDVASGQQTARQALTRTNVTALNIGPELNKIKEPSVTYMQISHDGQWLATVDEWLPPTSDLVHLVFDDEQAEIEQHLRLEVYLKLWSWDEGSGTWALASRIDNPHATPSGNRCKVVDLASNPSGVGFATFGEDGTVRAWKPTVRKRHGLDVRATDGKTLTTWSCRQVAELPAETGQAGKLGYSADGSVLATAFGSSSPLSVHLIDTESGEVRSSPTNLFHGPIFGIGILGRYLIILCDELCIWDMVSEELHFGFSFDATGLNNDQRRATTHLAIDHRHNSFAVVIPEIRFKVGSRVAIFNPERPVPLFTTSLPCTVTSLLPAAGRTGYHCIDTAAEIRTLMPSQSLPTSVTFLSKEHAASGHGLANIYGNGKAINGDEDQAILKLSSMHVQPDSKQEEGTRVVSHGKLAKVFEVGSANALPPVGDLFEKVAVLFAGR